MNYVSIKEVSMILRSLNHRTRQEILKNISNNKDMNITELSRVMHHEVSVISQHLAILRRAKIIKVIRDGKFVKFTINEEYLSVVNKFVNEFITESEKY
jgi:DNA-binding transcriptional ArsR family regulator